MIEGKSENLKCVRGYLSLEFSFRLSSFLWDCGFVLSTLWYPQQPPTDESAMRRRKIIRVCGYHRAPQDWRGRVRCNDGAQLEFTSLKCLRLLDDDQVSSHMGVFLGGSNFNDGTTQTARDLPLKGSRFAPIKKLVYGGRPWTGPNPDDRSEPCRVECSG
jgi:hypothetical protein